MNYSFSLNQALLFVFTLLMGATHFSIAQNTESVPTTDATTDSLEWNYGADPDSFLVDLEFNLEALNESMNSQDNPRDFRMHSFGASFFGTEMTPFIFNTDPSLEFVGDADDFAWSMDFMKEVKVNASERLGFFSGMGFGYQRINVQHELAASGGVLTNNVPDSAIVIKSNAINLGYVRVPLMIHVGGPRLKNGFHAFFGVVPGIRVMGRMDTRFERGDTRVHEQAKGFGLSLFQVNGRASVGIKRINFFAELPLLPMFEKDSTNPEVYPFAIGISLKTVK